MTAAENCKIAARDMAMTRHGLFEAEVKGIGDYVLGRIQKLVMTTPPLHSLYSTYAGTGISYYVFLADAVNMGVIKEREVTVDLLADYIGQRDFSYATYDRIKGLIAQEKAPELIQHARERAGKTTVEDMAEVSAKKVELEAEVSTKESAIDESGIQIKTNSTAVLSRWRGRVMYKFAAGECYGLHDPFGKKGALFKAKDDLKQHFDAKYYNGENSGEEFEGSWWLISTKHDLNNVLSVIHRA